MALMCSMMIYFSACEKEDLSAEKSGVSVPSNATTKVYSINSANNKGFSVEFLAEAGSPNIKADFIIIPQTGLTGDVMSPFLSHPNFERRFVLSKEFDDSKSAQEYFDAYNTAPEGEPLQQFALDLKANQVWLVKTIEGNFCKVLILETNVDKQTDFVEIKFKAEKMV